ncbi:MAG: riboflavin synthase, partial [Vibrio metschnikovii]
SLIKYVLPKGYIGLDGCSLTIGQVEANRFNVHLIPETLQRTLFGTRQVGDKINLEIDPQTQAIVDTVERVLAKKS